MPRVCSTVIHKDAINIQTCYVIPHIYLESMNTQTDGQTAATKYITLGVLYVSFGQYTTSFLAF